MLRKIAMNASYGPATTIGRNIALITAAVCGLVYLFAPSLQGATPAAATYFAMIGLILIGTLVFTAFRWKSLARRARREARAAGARGTFAFMQARFAARGQGPRPNTGPGWVIISDRSLVICARPSLISGGGDVERRELLFAEIFDVHRGEATSMSYAALVLSLTESDEEISLTLVPRNGSGLRGPREDEIDAAIADIRAAIATR